MPEEEANVPVGESDLREDPLENLRERVYRQGAVPGARVPAYTPQTQAPSYGWTPPPKPIVRRGMSWTARFAIAAGVFFLLAGGVAAFFLLHGTRAVSSDRVTITVSGPVTIASGDVVPLVVTIHNGNPTAISDATMIAALPDGTRDATNDAAPFNQYTDTLGTIPAGGDATRTIQAKFFGTQNQALSIPIRVEYHTEGSNALFTSNTTYALTISTSPISVQVSSLSQSASGQPLTLTVTVRSNATTPLPDVALLATYPPGFTPAQSATSSSPTFFPIGTLSPGENKVITVTGVLDGQTGDQRVFRFATGSANPDGTSTLGASYAEGDTTVTIMRPFLNLDLALNREEADTITVPAGTFINAALSWQNSLTSSIQNATIQITLSGNALDTSSIQGGTGFYRSSDSSIIFSSQTNSSLASLPAGDTGVGSFSFKTKPASMLGGVANPTVTLTVSISGKQVSDGGNETTLNATLTRKVQVGTNVGFTSTLLRPTGSAGPVPPVAGTESDYLVKWSLQNSLNSVGGAKVTATLPQYVRFTGTTDPADGSITYNTDSHTVTWNVGDLAAQQERDGSFQVAVLPSASQKGTSPIVVTDQNFTGTDRFTQGAVSAEATDVTTTIDASPASGTVQ